VISESQYGLGATAGTILQQLAKGS